MQKNAGKCWKMLENAGKCWKMLETASLILRVAFMPKKIMYLTDSKK
jgi:hypothetical protein